VTGGFAHARHARGGPLEHRLETDGSGAAGTVDFAFRAA
jgi:hypothetical protein